MSVKIEFVVSDTVINRIAEALEAQGMRLDNAEVFFRAMINAEFVNESDWLVEQALDYASVDHEGFEGSYVPPGVELVNDTSRLGKSKKRRGTFEEDLEVFDGVPS